MITMIIKIMMIMGMIMIIFKREYWRRGCAAVLQIAISIQMELRRIFESPAARSTNPNNFKQIHLQPSQQIQLHSSQQIQVRPKKMVLNIYFYLLVSFRCRKKACMVTMMSMKMMTTRSCLVGWSSHAMAIALPA